jgi:hypothetical protein
MAAACRDALSGASMLFIAFDMQAARLSICSVCGGKRCRRAQRDIAAGLRTRNSAPSALTSVTTSG